MSRRPDPAKAARLAELHRLADLRAERSAARLMRAQTAIDALETRADGLRTPLERDDSDPRMAVVADRHERWRRDQLIALNGEIALRRAHAEPLRQAQARDRARALVLEKLLGRRSR